MQRIATVLGMGEKKQILDEKIARLRATVSLESHDRVPVVGQADFWPVRYAQRCTMQEAFYSVDALAACYKDAFSEFSDWDAFDTMMYSLGPMLDATGSKRLKIPGRDISPHAEFQHPDLTLMDAKEYTQLIKDPVKFQIEEILPRLCKRLGSDDPSVRLKALAKAALFLGQWIGKARYYGMIWSNEYGIPPMLKGTAIYTPMDYIADKLRGFYQGLIDIKERAEIVQEACVALFPFLMSVGLPSGSGEGDYPLLFNPQHVSPFISPRDYERVYWPTFKKMIDQFVAHGHRVWVFFEHNQEQHLERLQELPKGKIVAHMESTDLAKAKKTLGGKICIAGGMSSVLLARGTPDEVKKRTLSVLKLFEDEPGFIMTCDKTIPVNARPENIRAWLNTMKEYGKIEGGLRIPEKDLDTSKGRWRSDQVVSIAGSTEVDHSRIPFTRWETVKAEFGKIEGDERIIQENWEELEKFFLPLIYWLIK